MAATEIAGWQPDDCDADDANPTSSFDSNDEKKGDAPFDSNSSTRRTDPTAAASCRRCYENFFPIVRLLLQLLLLWHHQLL
jgi:hypothetical protein